ncbi:hypothetical protein ACO1MR_14190, partial [Staphylococcus aureus]
MKSNLFLFLVLQMLGCSTIQKVGNEVKKDMGLPPTPVNFSANYDFVAGKNIIAAEDFMQTNAGDFPK